MFTDSVENPVEKTARSQARLPMNRGDPAVCTTLVRGRGLSRTLDRAARAIIMQTSRASRRRPAGSSRSARSSRSFTWGRPATVGWHTSCPFNEDHHLRRFARIRGLAPPRGQRLDGRRPLRAAQAGPHQRHRRRRRAARPQRHQGHERGHRRRSRAEDHRARRLGRRQRRPRGRQRPRRHRHQRPRRQQHQRRRARLRADAVAGPLGRHAPTRR